MGNRKQPTPPPGSPGYTGPPQVKPEPPPAPPRKRKAVAVDWTQVPPAWTLRCADCNVWLAAGDRVPRKIILRGSGSKIVVSNPQIDETLVVEPGRHLDHRIVFVPGNAE